MRKVFSFLILSLVIGYASEWGPYYISLFSVGRLEPIGYLQQFEHPCEDKKIANIECKSIYRIPQKLFGSGIRPRAVYSINWN